MQGLNKDMTSVNFDYFVERGTLLTEMARPARLTGVKNPPTNLVKAYADLRTIVGKKYGYDRSSSVDCIVFSFIYQELSNDTGPEHNALWRSAKTDCPKRKNAVLTILDDLNSRGFNFSELISSMIDENKLEVFIKKWRINSGGRSKGIENVLNKAGSSREEYMELLAELNPIMSQMMREMQGRKTSRKRRGEKSKYFKIPSQTSGESEPQEPFELKSDPDIANTELVLDAIDLLESYNETVSSTIQQIRQLYQTRLDEGKPVSREKFLSHMEKNISSISSPNIKSELVELVRIFKDLESDIAEIEDPDTEMGGIATMINNMNMSDSLTSSDLPENAPIDNDILLKYLKDGEVLNKFKLLLNLKKELEQDSATRKLERIKIPSGTESTPPNDEQKNGKKSFIITSERPPNPHHYELEAAKTLVNITRKNLMKYGNLPENHPDKRKLMDKLKEEAKNLKEIQAKYDEWKQSKSGESFGEGVASYMTEQFQKDTKFGKQRGQFVERGFKKITNYGQWMMLND